MFQIPMEYGRTRLFLPCARDHVSDSHYARFQFADIPLTPHTETIPKIQSGDPLKTFQIYTCQDQKRNSEWFHHLLEFLWRISPDCFNLMPSSLNTLADACLVVQIGFVTKKSFWCQCLSEEQRWVPSPCELYEESFFSTPPRNRIVPMTQTWWTCVRN